LNFELDNSVREKVTAGINRIERQYYSSKHELHETRQDCLELTSKSRRMEQQLDVIKERNKY
jgi:hypothetical protein